MIRRTLISTILALGLAQPAFAAAREVSQAEVRSVVNSGQSIGLAQAMQTVARHIEGDTVDVRVFDADGLIYNILIMLPNGKMANVFVDGASGDFVAPNSQRAKSVASAARSSRGNNGKAKSANKSKGKSKGKAKGKKDR